MPGQQRRQPAGAPVPPAPGGGSPAGPSPAAALDAAERAYGLAPESVSAQAVEALVGRRVRAARRRKRIRLEGFVLLWLVGLAVLVGGAVRPLGLAWSIGVGTIASPETPLSWAGAVASEVPVGWALLLRLVASVGGAEALRFVPLAVGALAVVPAYLLGRRAVARAPILGGFTCGLVMALGPVLASGAVPERAAMEAFTVCALLALVGWVEARLVWQRGLVFGFAGAAGVLLAGSAVPVLAFAFAALLTRAASRRAWGPSGAAAVGVAAGSTAVAGLAWLGAATGGSIVAAGTTPGATAGGAAPGSGLGTTIGRVATELGSTGVGPWWLLLALGVLALVGVGALWRSGWAATAGAAGAAWLGIALLAALGAGAPAGALAGWWSEPAGPLLVDLLVVLAGAGTAWLLALPSGRRSSG